MNWVLFWLALHIIAAVVAFGPTFAFPLIGVLAGRYPQHGHFAFMINDRIERFLVIPFAGSSLRQTTRIDIEPGARLVFWEGLMAGRVARGERWRFRELS